MPIYEFKCRLGHHTERLMSIHAPSKFIRCPQCNKRAKRVFSCVNTDLVNNERWSESMGVNPDQIPEAERTFPGSTYDSEGRLLIKNRKHKLFEMKRRGWSELD